jgi:CRP/FNR family transcriptional regulator, cyclic AMP receptor protein
MLTSVDRLLFIRSVPIFKELRDDFLVRLASVMDEMAFAANYTIITEGHEGRALYIVVSGRVRVHLHGQELAQLDQNACFGEMSVFDAEPRSASVTTIEPCNCLVLTQQQLYDAIDETPGIAVNIIRLLSRRIRELNRDLNQKQQEIKELQRLPLPYLTESPAPEPELQPSPGTTNGQSTLPEPQRYFPYGQIPY